VTRLRKMMLEELQRRNYSAITTCNYVRVVNDFTRLFWQVPRQARLQQASNLSSLSADRAQLTPGTVVNRVAALRFFFVKMGSTQRSHCY
jgi:integrase/recombinase XerD